MRRHDSVWPIILGLALAVAAISAQIILTRRCAERGGVWLRQNMTCVTGIKEIRP